MPMPPETPPPEALALLTLMAQAPADGVSLPWLAKRLDLRASQVLRLLAPWGNAGAGWLDVAVDDGQWRIRITAAGRACLTTD